MKTETDAIAALRLDGAIVDAPEDGSRVATTGTE